MIYKCREKKTYQEAPIDEIKINSPDLSRNNDYKSYNEDIKEDRIIPNLYNRL
jgi:hypothetical protein